PLTSPALAQFLQKQIEVHGRLAFLIGGPVGFSDDVLAAAHHQIALSPLTFTHELARVIFLEQLYRAFTILNGENYHK
ncbi:MAG: 23S rRNA (pseudouridine(1915)-N(3))-methyltransferase RlmH, partial [Chloroflexi bacterium]|nr:23S rRNA (pseudouridine(1915)-N(3))-methyltransferase RlmH [Chloroflexota bacterium]